MQNGAHNSRKRSLAQTSAETIINSGVHIIKRARHILKPTHPAQTPVGDVNFLDSLPNELRLYILNKVPYPLIWGLRTASKGHYEIVAKDYYMNLLNSPLVQADLQTPIKNEKCLQEYFKSQELEIKFLLRCANNILQGSRALFDAFIFNLDCPSAIPAACERYLGEAYAEQCNKVINALPAYLRNGTLGLSFSTAIGERTFSISFWIRDFVRIQNALATQLEKLKTLPETVSPFNCFVRHQLLNDINEKIVRLKIAASHFSNRPPREVSFNSSHLTRLPANLFNDAQLYNFWRQCDALLLRNNFLSTLPLNLSKFQNIIHVDLVLNDIEIFPTVLSSLPLTGLKLEDNKLSEVPDKLRSCLKDKYGYPITKETLLKFQNKVKCNSEVKSIGHSI